MKDFNLKDLLAIAFIVLCIGTMAYFVTGSIVQNKDVLVKEDSEYLYYKEYTLYNKDSAVYKYHKPIIYDCTVVDKRTHGGFVGVPGKGGHPVRYYYTYFKYNGKTIKESGADFYNHFNVGDKLKVKEVFYPDFRIEYIY